MSPFGSLRANSINIYIYFYSAFFSSPDFANGVLVEQEPQGEEDQALDEGGDEHPAQGVKAEWVLVGVDAVAAQDLDLNVHPGQLQQAVPKAELGEYQQGVTQLVEDVLDELHGGREIDRERCLVWKSELT